MKILIVEDERTLREGLRDLLQAAGHEVEVAGDGRSGLERAGTETFDLVVLDLMLPRMDGIEVCRRLRQIRRRSRSGSGSCWRESRPLLDAMSSNPPSRMYWRPRGAASTWADTRHGGDPR